MPKQYSPPKKKKQLKINQEKSYTKAHRVSQADNISHFVFLFIPSAFIII